MRSCGVPIDLRTRAPTPSDCSLAKKTFRIALGIVILDNFGALSIASGEKAGRPRKSVMMLLEKWSATDLIWVRSVSLYAIDRNAMIVENRKKRTFMRMMFHFIGSVKRR